MKVVPVLRAALGATLLLVILCGGLYPLLVFGLAQLCFPAPANGSLIVDANGAVRGSRLIGQPFASPRFFHPRPSAAGSGYDGLASGGSNLGPASRSLRDAIAGRVAAYRAENGLPADQPVPADAVTASGSGLDPHISPTNARLQVARVAAARSLPPARVAALVESHVEPPQCGVLGDPRVNVLLLNLALETMKPEDCGVAGAD